MLFESKRYYEGSIRLAYLILLPLPGDGTDSGLTRGWLELSWLMMWSRVLQDSIARSRSCKIERDRKSILGEGVLWLVVDPPISKSVS